MDLFSTNHWFLPQPTLIPFSFFYLPLLVAYFVMASVPTATSQVLGIKDRVLETLRFPWITHDLLSSYFLLSFFILWSNFWLTRDLHTSSCHRVGAWEGLWQRFILAATRMQPCFSSPLSCHSTLPNISGNWKLISLLVLVNSPLKSSSL